MYHYQENHTCLAGVKKTVTIPECSFFQLVASDDTATIQVELGGVTSVYSGNFVYSSPQGLPEPIPTYAIGITSDKNTTLYAEYWKK